MIFHNTCGASGAFAGGFVTWKFAIIALALGLMMLPRLSRTSSKDPVDVVYGLDPEGLEVRGGFEAKRRKKERKLYDSWC